MMSSGYFYMALALTCFSVLGISAKVADTKGCRPSALYALLYAWALIFSSTFVLGFQNAGTQAPASVYWIALPFGMCSAVAGLAFQVGIRYGKIATSWLIINLSAAVPAAASLIFYHEPVNPKKIVVLCLVALSIFLLWKDKQQEELKKVSTMVADGKTAGKGGAA